MFQLQKNPIKPNSPVSPSKIREQAVMPYKSKSSSLLPDMDPGIWSRLPEELLDLVLSFLPLKTFLNLRSTCKHFSSLVFSPAFMSKHSSSGSPFCSFVLLSHPQFDHCYSLYDSVLGTWRNLTLSLSFLLPSSAVSGNSQSCNLLSSSNGLFCFSIPSSCSFLVCNFLAKTSKVIEFPTYPFAFESLTFVSTPFGYKIFVLCSKFSSISAFIYDSRLNSWQKIDSLEPILRDNCHQGGVFFNGSLHYPTPEPFSVVYLDLDSREWKRFSNKMPEELTFVRLVSDGERKLYMIGGIGRNGISKMMKLWEFCNGENWVEIGSLPEMMCRKFVSVCYHNYEHVYCFWHQGMVCVCCFTWPEILYYKVSRKTWHWLPKCPSLPDKWSCGFRWFSFVPELYASV
ncbi:F-box/kelch-repeat protein At5g43190-like [Manihot esculenta]|uniref:Uncharacterized protein n=1 Tax=Manihot esculenta TaxID=3983 RepID=A0ACB7HVH4_MANES|nr:F-box/kelch-repeat protein At5g43190-like [Manihot esculenta]KAG8654821.1 hypothetical protein MANES_05G181850v8 [Manihot esculenta]